MKESSNSKNCNDIRDLGYEKSGGAEGASSIGDHCFFLVINPKDADSLCKNLLLDVLNMYMKELPAMNYAANTGKESMFLERCVFSGKYCTLLLMSEDVEGTGELIAALTYQIIPVETQYAEILLATVSSIHRRKGIGSLVYVELRKRLQSVGVRTILCWGDNESERFWLKQGFVSVAEVDTKGRARRLPVKANIRRALSFPGGSTLMVSHLNMAISTNPTKSLALGFSLKPHMKPLPSVVLNQGVGGVGDDISVPSSLNQMSLRIENSQPEVLAKEKILTEHNNLNGSPSSSALRGCRDLVHFESTDCSHVVCGFELNKSGVKCCSCFAQGVKRTWEASWSSLKSKKVKGGHLVDCQLVSNQDLISESDKRNDTCFDCSLHASRSSSLVEATSLDSLTNISTEKGAGNSGVVNMMAKVSREIVPKQKCFRIMLMNIADDSKKTSLTKIIEELGGIVVSEGIASTHVITGKVRKTLNFCTALCSGAWMLSPSWLKESFREGRFVDESPFVLKDEDYELKYRTKLEDAVLKAKAMPRALLKDYDICLSTHIQPPVKALSVVVKCAGGNVIRRLDAVKETSKTIFVACEEDMEEALSAVKKGICSFSFDWFMNCIMRQELELGAPQFVESL